MKQHKIASRTSEHYYLSEQGLERLTRNLEELREKRKEQVAALTTIREQQSDEVSVEDAGYIYAKGLIEFIDTDIERIESILAHAKVMSRDAAIPQEVSLGSRVKLKSDNQSFEYTIVQSFEADPSDGKISTESPLGRQLLGKRLWDKISFRHSRRRKPMSFKLVSIH